MFRRLLIGTLCACSFVFLLDGLSAYASKRDDSRVRVVIRKAVKLLDDLEYERGRELLEAAARDGRNKKAKKVHQARLWAVLGRARAELADHMGADDAFERAVRLDRSVKLSKSTSPKIRQSLDRARKRVPADAPPTVIAQAPPPKKDPPPPPPKKVTKKPPPKKVTKKPPPKKVTKKPPPKKVTKKPPPKKVTKKPPPKKVTKKPPPEKVTETPPPKKATENPPPPPAEPPPAADPNEPQLAEHRSKRGLSVSVPKNPALGSQVRIEVQNAPAGPIDVFVRRTQAGAFVPLPVQRTGETAEARFTMEGARVEFYVRAGEGEARDQVGSPTEPKLLRAGDGPPSLAQAWSSPPPPTQNTSTSSTAFVPTQVTEVSDNDADSGLSGTEIAVIAGSSAVVVAGVTALIIIFASRTPQCEAPEGFGCTDIQVLPLLSF